MNINKITTAILAACFLTSCDFSEDDCPRHGMLRAWCDFEQVAPAFRPDYEECHLHAFGTREYDIPPATFSSDTLHWSLPRDTYDFVFYSGCYRVEDGCCPLKMRLAVPTKTVGEKEYIVEKQTYCTTSLFQKEVFYQKTTDAEIMPTQFVQRLNLKVNVIGDTQILESIQTELDGIYTNRCISSKNCYGQATVIDKLSHVKDTNSWIVSNWMFGFNPKIPNILSLHVRMNEENSQLNETQTVNLSHILAGNESPEVSVEIDLYIGKELTIGSVTTIPEWEDIPETDLTK